MFLGPFVSHRLLSSSRYRSTYLARVFHAFIPTASLLGIWLYWDVLGWGASTTIPLNLLAYALMFTLIVGPSMTTLQMWAVSSDAIPQERHRKTLDALLSTQLSSLEIVTGLIAKAMVSPLAGLVAVLPIACFMVAYWRIDPREMGLMVAGLLATMFFLATLGIAGSAGATSTSRAAMRAFWNTFLWAFGPTTVLVLILPRVGAGLAVMLRPIMLLGLDASPMGLFVNLFGLFGRGSIVDSTLRMIALELLGAVVLIAFTAIRFRSASRAVYDTEGRVARALGMKSSPRKRWRPCGEDPIFWRERFSTRGQNRAERWGGFVLQAVLLGLVVWITYFLAKPAFQETIRYGYKMERGDPSLSALDLFAEAYLRGTHGPPPRGMARPEFNMALRVFTPFIHLLILMLSFGLSAESLSTEQKRDTWQGLIVTPLSGWEILRGKASAVAWRVRGYLFLLLMLWLLGMITGSIHPIGFVFALIGLTASFWLSIAFGLYLGLHSKDQVRQFLVLPFFLALLSGILGLIPFAWGKSIWLGTGSMPYLTFLSLFTFEDVNEGWKSGRVAMFNTYGFEMLNGFAMVSAACLLAWTTQGLGAIWLQRVTIRDFDGLVGRAVRAQGGENRASGPL